MDSSQLWTFSKETHYGVKLSDIFAVENKDRIVPSLAHRWGLILIKLNHQNLRLNYQLLYQ